MNFNQLPLHERILKAIADTGYTKPTPIQLKAIPKVAKGADVIGIAQTGTGKTAAFTLPLLSKLVDKTEANESRHTRVLIIAPTRELVQQIHENVRGYAKYTNLRTGVIIGGVSDKGQIAKLNSGVDILVATPGRLLDLVEKGHGNFHQIEVLVLDEADRMLDMGFIPDIRTIVKKLPKSKQTLLFSATLNSQIESLTKEFLNSPTLIEVERRASPADTIEQIIYEIQDHQKTELLEHLLNSSHEFYAVMVFARTKLGAEELSTALKMEGFTAEAIHGDRSQGQRKRALDDFKKGKVRVLVATDVAARGIDVDSITHVINYDFPEQSEDYIHRIGRTGRAGAKGVAITFVTQRNQQALKKVEKLIQKTLPKKIVEDFEYDQSTPEPIRRPVSKVAPKSGRTGDYQNKFANRKNNAGAKRPGGSGNKRKSNTGKTRRKK
ncbi:MAG: ATP-dependent RNA helicase RhlE [Rubritalea sp.]|jgi:ATP-dependent RNA helicase RhlE